MVDQKDPAPSDEGASAPKADASAPQADAPTPDEGQAPSQAADGSEPVFSLKTLRRVEMLKDLSDQEIAALDSQCRWEEYSDGDEVISFEDVSGEVYFVVRGAVRVVHHIENGQQIGYTDRGAGQIVGELSAIDGEPRSATVFAKARSIVGVMERATFIDLIKGEPQVTIRLLIYLTRLVREMNLQFRDIESLSEVQRVYYEILRRAEPNPEGDGWYVFHMPRHKELAEVANTTPEIVAHAVSQLMKQELVRRRAGSLELLDKKSIQQLALR